MPTLDTSLLSDCKTLAYQVAPELKKRPLYIVPLSLFDGLKGIMQGRCLAWADSGHPCDFAFRERIGDAWQGVGPLVALDATAIAEASRPDAFRDAVLNVCLHELAHLLPPPAEYPTRDFAELFDVPGIRAHQELRRVQAENAPEPLPDSERNCHNAVFVRTATHLFGRSLLAGWQIPSFDLYGSSLWFLPQPAHLLEILFREVVEMRDRSFREIVASTPPQAFTDLWQECLDFHVKRETEEVTQ